MSSFVTDVVFNYSETYLEMNQSLVHGYGEGVIKYLL